MKHTNRWITRKMLELSQHSIKDGDAYAYVFPEALQLVFSRLELEELSAFMTGQTGPLIGKTPAYYTHDVEQWIRGLPNRD